MRRQPPYSLLKNGRYALAGFWEVLRQERAFQIEVVVGLVVWVGLIFLQAPWWAKVLLGLSVLIVWIVELGNSAIERVVDLCTTQSHPMAKKAKDAAAAMVMITLLLVAGIWMAIFWWLMQESSLS